MDISGIFFIEEGNISHIHLYKEGSFWKAYENSAYLFVQHIKAYQTRLRYYKNIDQEIISIGFPDVALPKIIQAVETQGIASLRNQSATSIEIELEETSDGRDAINRVSTVREWKLQTSLTIPSKKLDREREMTQIQQNYWTMAIRSFPIADKTPLECMQFISELQKSVMDYKL
ncbi:hypothetical protein FACS189440_16010 [Bacteroidia bacterium]|nr:hypothetical protein FACS189440_16010 [Bacteroidia bacterium]